ncbi:hypothetical protein Y032_0003g1324 [Ancylostoma ceylanicum]|uniref:Uncharacterized protein n=1 Tax=Ancylostoma ceylanicum TaxID=53326 RepID=A0A016VX99_9BILA|nr:hypothetical protein Y032_0003g1324 [Ancylostoma ceylanicum]
MELFFLPKHQPSQKNQVLQLSRKTEKMRTSEPTDGGKLANNPELREEIARLEERNSMNGNSTMDNEMAISEKDNQEKNAEEGVL